MMLNLTYLDSNSWLIKLGGKRVLLDPWLVGSLVFGNLPWLFKGEKRIKKPIPESIDLILLSQGLEDHAHPPTLKVLDKNIPIVGSPKAGKVAKELGFKEINILKHGESFTLENAVQITAVPGSPIGPTLLENGYVLKGLETGTTLYYEPHGSHSPTLKEFGSIDAIITPLIGIALPFLGSVIKGQETALEVAKWLKPKVMLPTAAGGDIEFTGLLTSLLKPVGTVEEFQKILEKEQLETRVIEAQPGVALDVF